MVKCPRGTPSQVQANLAYISRLNRRSTSNDYIKDQDGKKREILFPESAGSDFASIRADKRCPPTARDELVYFFISSFLDILLESWHGKPCLKQKLGGNSAEGEFEGEDVGSCDISAASSTADFLKDLYEKRSSSLSKNKIEKESEETESEYLNEEDFESPGTPRPLTDEDVHFTFPNGVWYKGRVSRKLMDGEGFYFWEDGTSFEGDFEGSFITGKGRLIFPDLSTYEGGVYKAFRHGEGMFCFSDSPVMYSGEWWLGKKHGHGLILYNDPSEGPNFYKGQWQNGFKEGFGYRQYLSGAKYIGFWSNGKRHGRGVMLWTNHDIYRGQWKEGLMHGYGEYTWNGFLNNTLSYPASNTYHGYWEEGKRSGWGCLELKNGCIIETFWVNNLKDGPGSVICENGTVVMSENLFLQDKPVHSGDQEHLTESSWKDRSHLHKKKKYNKVISIPIKAPVHNLNLSYHIQKLHAQIKEKQGKNLKELEMESEFVSMTPKPSDNDVDNPKENCELRVSEGTCGQTCAEVFSRLQKEEKFLRNFLISKMSILRDCYTYYANLTYREPPMYNCILLRLFFWQMLINGGVPDSNLSLIDIDDVLEKEEYVLLRCPHDPFEGIRFWQFVQILIILSWHLYGRHVFAPRPLLEDERVKDFLEYYGNCEFRHVLKTALEYFIDKHLFWESGIPPDRISVFEESDFAPMEAMYLIYHDVGEPHSVRDFVNVVCSNSQAADVAPRIVRYFEKLPFFKIEGKNALTISGRLQHIPESDPFNTPEIFQLEELQVSLKPRSELTCFNNLKARKVLGCLLEICPGIMEDGFMVNMDYKLTFLEFYRAIVLCTKKQLKMKAIEAIRDDVIAEYKLKLEEYNKQMNESEKLKEGLSASRKKSRQFSDTQKKGKK